jgi:N-acetylmuramoyl-L-alanine amidase
MDGDIAVVESRGMGRLSLALLLAILALPDAAAGATAPRSRAARARSAAARASARAPARATSLADAKADLRALTRDRTRRRYRHQWEKAISQLLAAARGRDAGPAYLEASRARYALYRWSADEADRDKALILAERARTRGVPDAAALAQAIRRERGDDGPARAAPARRPSPAARPAPPPADEDENEDPRDPALDAAVAELVSPSTAPAATAGEGDAPATVSEVRAWSSSDYTRVAVYLSRAVRWKTVEFPADKDRPRRLALDLSPARLAGAAVARPVAGEQVDQVRAAQHDGSTVRVVLELPGTDGLQVFALEEPPRLIVDVGARPEPVQAPAVAAAGPSATSATAPVTPNAMARSPATSTSTAVPRATARSEPATATAEGDVDGEEVRRGALRRIVVDAGHGGHDPGAIGPTRVREKDVTLAIARRLARKLEKAGFEVVLTRGDDRFLALEERTAVANTARADLFVSVHANAHPRRSRVGVESYFLNVADDRYAARLAARENGLADGAGEGEVTRILTDLDAKQSAGASRQLALLIQRDVCAGIRGRVGDVRDLGVKSALFYVLLGARMPAVLVETGFISNRDEERRLASARYQEEVADGIVRAVRAFAQGSSRLASAR